MQRRLFDADAAEVARVDSDGDGVISAVEGDIDTPSDGFADNTRGHFEEQSVPIRWHSSRLEPSLAPLA